MHKTYEEISSEVSSAVDAVRDYSYFDYPVGLILGSGMELGELFEEVHAETEFAAIPHLTQPSVTGHGGRLVMGEVAVEGGDSSVNVAVLAGRLHYYEGHSMYDVTFPVRVLEGIGAGALVSTTSSGGLDSSFSPGNIMLHTDFINRMGTDPLRGIETNPPDARFLDLSDPYDDRLTDLLAKSCVSAGLTVHRGIFAAESGPTYETRAEARLLREAGADAVSMSTVPEVTVANLLGLRTAGISLITNVHDGGAISHEEVLEAAQEAADELIDGLAGFVAALARETDIAESSD